MEIITVERDSRERGGIGMAIGPIPYGHLQKRPTLGRVKPRFMGLGLGMGNYPQIWMDMGTGMGTILPSPATRIYVFI